MARRRMQSITRYNNQSFNRNRNMRIILQDLNQGIARTPDHVANLVGVTVCTARVFIKELSEFGWVCKVGSEPCKKGARGEGSHLYKAIPEAIEDAFLMLPISREELHGLTEADDDKLEEAERRAARALVECSTNERDPLTALLMGSTKGPAPSLLFRTE